MEKDNCLFTKNGWACCNFSGEKQCCSVHGTKACGMVLCEICHIEKDKAKRQALIAIAHDYFETMAHLERVKMTMTTTQLIGMIQWD